MFSIYQYGKRVIPPHSTGVFLLESSARKIIKNHNLKNAEVKPVIVLTSQVILNLDYHKEFLGETPVVDTTHDNQLSIEDMEED